ncbi:hypothetical protein chiPu_0023177 [Chiloscyllium punctatum]|uniref:Uncharacterized protein n=3 Tax=Chiloscyllium punctatum TaxID=137246 RepID=A0A401T8R3_CHIPU|nr:hypothetical protein [Chiloscyllium punctatum]
MRLAQEKALKRKLEEEQKLKQQQLAAQLHPLQSTPAPPSLTAPAPPIQTAMAPQNQIVATPSVQSAPAPPNLVVPVPPVQTTPAPPSLITPAPPSLIAPSPAVKTIPAPPSLIAPGPSSQAASKSPTQAALAPPSQAVPSQTTTAVVVAPKDEPMETSSSVPDPTANRETENPTIIIDVKEEEEGPMALDETSHGMVVMDTDSAPREHASQQPVLHQVGHLVARDHGDVTEQVILVRDEPVQAEKPALGSEPANTPEEPMEQGAEGGVPEEKVEEDAEKEQAVASDAQQPITKRKSALRKSS